MVFSNIYNESEKSHAILQDLYAELHENCKLEIIFVILSSTKSAISVLLKSNKLFTLFPNNIGFWLL